MTKHSPNRGGHLLILGCGSGSALNGLSDADYQSVLGVDLSEEGIRIAAERFGSRKVRFEIGDMARIELFRKYNAILFHESIYYLSPGAQIQLLDRLRDSLEFGGAIILTIADAGRYSEIVNTVTGRYGAQACHSKGRVVMVIEVGG